MPVLNSQACGDTYSTSGARLLDIWNGRGGWFSVSGNAAFVQAQYGPRGESHFTEEIEFGDGAFVIIPPQCHGLQFRNAVAGQVATVTAQIAQGDEPPLAVSSVGTVTTITVSTITRQIFVASGTYTLPSGCKAILAEVLGGGGGGGGSGAPPAGQFSAGGGGQGGSCAASLITSPAATYVVTVGGSGAGGVGNAQGGRGGSSSLGAVVLAVGGFGGLGGGAGLVPPLILNVAGDGSSAGSTGDIISTGFPGLYSFAQSPTNAVSGTGGAGAGPYGGGGGGGRANSTGNGGSGNNYGGGGAGALSLAGAGAQNGGAGAPGIVVVTEFY